MWDAQAKEAAGLGFRVIRYDQRGHGKSDAPAGDYTLQRLGDDVIDLLDALEDREDGVLRPVDGRDDGHAARQASSAPLLARSRSATPPP